MGLLVKGTPLSWKQIVEARSYIKTHGLKQFIAIYNQFKNTKGDPFIWGDEVEYTLVKFDDERRKARALLLSEELLEKLRSTSNKTAPGGGAIYEPEYSGFQIEMTPGEPYEGVEAAVDVVEKNLKWRRESVAALLEADETIMAISFPSIGADNEFTWPALELKPGDPASVSSSIFVPDAALCQDHPRYRLVTQHIRDRRGGRKVCINIPIFKDKNTPSPFVEAFERDEEKAAALPDHIYMDHLAFGAGCCCQQVTLQCASMDEARWLYDQLIPITPVFVALSAATPIFRSYLADDDSRWMALTAATDDRTRGESGEAPLVDGELRIARPRYFYADAYLSPSSASLNDLERVFHDEHFKLLLDGGVDETYARHIAHLFVFKERIEQDDANETEHFDTILSSVWQSIRLKPPIADSKMGWRIEFRPTEVSLTDSENAAFICFIVFLARAILALKLDFRLPISSVMKNMERVHLRDAARTQQLYWNCGGDEKRELTLNEIINGDGGNFAGLVPLIQQYLEESNIKSNIQAKLQRYLTLIQKRASGELKTLARWMRDFVDSHADYKHNSHVPDSTIYDMLKEMDKINKGERKCAELLGDLQTSV